MNTILRLKDVEKTTGLKRSTIYNLIQADRFPRPSRIGKRAVGWPRSEIKNWLETRPEAGSWSRS